MADGARLFGPWKEWTEHLANMAGNMTMAGEAESMRAAGWLADKIKETVRTSGESVGRPFTPLKPETIRRKRGGTKPLIDKGDLVGSIHAHQLKSGVWFVGLLRTEPHPRAGMSMANLGEIHEQPYYVAVPKAGVRRIPARKFVEPTIDKYGGHVNARITKSVTQAFMFRGGNKG